MLRLLILSLQIGQYHLEEARKGFQNGGLLDEFQVVNLFIHAGYGATQEAEDVVFDVVHASQALLIGFVVTLNKEVEEPLEFDIPFAINYFLGHYVLQDFKDIII
jgi:hypothetical protein